MAERTKTPSWDYALILVSMSLIGLGLVMVFSSSSVLAQKRFGDPFYFFRPQIIYACLGLILMLIARKLPYQWHCRLAYPYLLGIIILLILVMIPGVGHRAGGASRWLRFAGISFQPSEFAKLALVFYLSYSLAAKRDKVKRFEVGLFPHLVILGVLVGLVVAEPDLGAAVILTFIALVLFFVAGVPLSHLISLGMLSIPVVWLAIIKYPYRMQRITAFISPWEDPLGSGYHIIHSFLAFASGGLFGAGPGAGTQKLFFLPECHTDFIFSVVGEEFGFLGVITVAFLFLVFVARGVAAALNAHDLEGTYMAMGLTLIIGLQAFMNMAVALGLMPTKGLILPFFSYGGTAMVVNFLCLGVLLNIGAQGRLEK
ncbi:MAG: putative lipid II flippase FtsW [Pseudomonadota bacterium]